MKRESFPPAEHGRGGPRDEFPPLPSPPAAAPAPGRPKTAQVFLGIFILWQIVFLFVSNFVNLGDDLRKEDEYRKKLPRDMEGVIKRTFPDWFDKKGYFHDFCAVLFGLTKRWEAFSGQPQGWSLFAPGITRQITFVAVELRWDDPEDRHEGAGHMAPYPPELLLSENEPPDKARFFRVGKFRLRKYESYLDTVLRQYEAEVDEETGKVTPKETLREAVERWPKRIRDKVDDEEDNIVAYLHLRCKQYLESHPGRPHPRQVILLVRRFEIPKPGEFSEDWYNDPHGDPHRELPLARCLIDAEGGWSDLEWYKPVLDKNNNITGTFEPLHRPENAPDARQGQKNKDDENDDDDDD